MSNLKLKVGIIGMGIYAATDHIPNLRATRRAEIVAASRRDPERLALAQREHFIPQTFTDWREMLEKDELDAVVVATPTIFIASPRWLPWIAGCMFSWKSPWSPRLLRISSAAAS